MEREVTKRDLLFIYDVAVVRRMEKAGVKYLCSAIANGSNKKFWLYARTERAVKILESMKN